MDSKTIWGIVIGAILGGLSAGLVYIFYAITIGFSTTFAVIATIIVFAIPFFYCLTSAMDDKAMWLMIIIGILLAAVATVVAFFLGVIISELIKDPAPVFLLLFIIGLLTPPATKVIVVIVEAVKK